MFSAKSSDEANEAESKIHSKKRAERNETPRCRLTATSSTHSFKLVTKEKISYKTGGQYQGVLKTQTSCLTC